jgi:hypothetical protein
MVTPFISEDVRDRAEELSRVERQVVEGAFSEARVFRSGHVVVAASLALASAVTALVALAGLIALV